MSIASCERLPKRRIKTLIGFYCSRIYSLIHHLLLLKFQSFYIKANFIYCTDYGVTLVKKCFDGDSGLESTDAPDSGLLNLILMVPREISKHYNDEHCNGMVPNAMDVLASSSISVSNQQTRMAYQSGLRNSCSIINKKQCQ